MPFASDFFDALFWLFQLEIAMAAIFAAAILDNSAFAVQLPPEWQRVHPGKKFLPLASNATSWMAIFVANPVAAYILGWHAQEWSFFKFAIDFEVMFILGAFGLLGLLEDSKINWSAFFQDGRLTLAGGMYQMVLWPLQVSTTLGFYILTPHGQTTTQEVVFITILLVFTWLVSTLQPPKKLHGELNAPAVAMAFVGTLLLVGLAIYRLKFA